MADRELLELTAKAAGVDLQWQDDGSPGYYGDWRGLPQWEQWNPLTDDGDALRLAVKLGIEHKKPSRNRSVGRVVQAWFPPDGNPSRAACAHVSAKTDGDVLAATRRAIVLAAAEVARQFNLDLDVGGCGESCEPYPMEIA